MNPRQIGLKNQRKSVQFVLKNTDKYGIFPDKTIDKKGKVVFSSDRVHNIGVGRFQDDLFGRFDIITMPEVEDFPVYLIQVKSDSFNVSSTANLEYLNDIMEFIVPKGVVKELHIWKKIMKIPQIITL